MRIDSLHRVKATALLPVFAALPANTVLEANLKTVLSVWADREAKDSFLLSPNQFSIVSAIAHQCPFDGGNAVYMARALYNRNQYKSFRGDSICTPDVPRTVREDTPFSIQPEVLWSPNPAVDLLFINIEAETADAIVSLKLTNISGQLAWEGSLPLNDGKASIETKYLPNGVYFANLILDGMRLHTAKIIIQHD